MLPNLETNVGSPRSRVDGPAKVTGAAQYSAEFQAPDLAHGVVVSGDVAKGRITKLDTAAALAVPGVVQVFPVHVRLYVRQHERALVITSVDMIQRNGCEPPSVLPPTPK